MFYMPHPTSDGLQPKSNGLRPENGPTVLGPSVAVGRPTGPSAEAPCFALIRFRGTGAGDLTHLTPLDSESKHGPWLLIRAFDRRNC